MLLSPSRKALKMIFLVAQVDKTTVRNEVSRIKVDFEQLCAKVKASFPACLHGPLQYDDGLKAFVINLLVCQMVALNRVQKSIKSMMDVTLAEVSLLKFIWRLHQALEAWEVPAKDELLKMPAMNVDETSLKVDKKNHWIHVYSAGDITLKCLDRGGHLRIILIFRFSPKKAVK